MIKQFIATCLFCLVVICANSQNIKKLQKGDIFPQIKGELLSSKKITLPNHCKGKVSVLIVAFKRGTQPQIDTWTKPLLREFSMNKDFRFIEIPMISGFYSFMSNYINNGMRKGIVRPMHKNVMTYYGPLSDYFKMFDVENNKLCYLFLLDRDGTIHYMNKGESNEAALQSLIEKTKGLLADRD
jgi:hypothetical protein